MQNLADHVAIVTGAGRGVGRCIALRLARAGAQVAALARTESELRALANEPDAAGRITPIVADVSDETSVDQAMATITGFSAPVDLLVNNAGVYVEKSIVETTPEEWRRLFEVNVLGTVLVTRKVLPGLLSRKRGCIINICSTASHLGYANQSAYCASKHAMLGFTRVLATETHGTGVRVHAVSPGGINTTFVTGRPHIDPSQYMGPDEVAEVVEFLARMDGIATMDEIVMRREGATPFRC